MLKLVFPLPSSEVISREGQGQQVFDLVNNVRFVWLCQDNPVTSTKLSHHLSAASAGRDVIGWCVAGGMNKH